MKFCICLLLAIASLGAAEKAPAAASGVKKANRAQAAGIPAGAVQTSPGIWRHTDAQGKTWTYRKTPFGIARVEEKPAKPAAAEADAARLEEAELNSIRGVEDGDNVRFERSGPFGVYRWSKAKSALNEMERKAWERDSKKAAAPAKDKQE